MPDVTINYLAIIVCGILALGIGAIWYGPLFGKPWMKAHGFNESDLVKDFNPVKIFSLAMAAHMIIAYILAYLMGYLNAYSLSGVFYTSFFSWLGFLFLPMFINFLFSRKSIKLLMIESLYFLLFFIVAAFLISIWK